MKKLYLSILWHQHQPFYKDRYEGGEYQMPWVFLHAIKDYYEMAAHVLNACQHGAPKVNINIVPSLAAQLADYEDCSVNDKFIKTLRKPSETLTEDERVFLLTQFCLVNRSTMLPDFPRFADILDKFDRHMELTFNEILDASVLYLLCWTGVYFRSEKPVSDILAKGSGYTEIDKNALLDFYADKIKEIVPLHRKLQDMGAVEVSFTPFYHPILPLLADFSSAREAMPVEPMPALSGTFEDDFKEHVNRGFDYHKKTFLSEPCGVWPAEGSVSPVTVDYYIDKGLKWVATDEDILARSIGKNLKNFPERELLYKRYCRKKGGKSAALYFRDKVLSDLIGFTYSSWDEKSAVDDFISRLKNIYDACSFSPHVSIVLDGENAWEFYKKNAYDFFNMLYKELLSCDWLEMELMKDGADKESEVLENLACGSWINGNFKIWCGHPEKNRAWELLSMTRADIMPFKGSSAFDNAYEELFISEGSDWFWWYGDDHFTSQASLFDGLFRNHLINAYSILGLATPEEINIPIKASPKSGLVSSFSRRISPKIDGKDSFYSEWLGCAEFDLLYDEGSMHKSGVQYLKTLYYGFDYEFFYFRIEPSQDAVFDEKCEFSFEMNSQKFIFQLNRGVVSEKDGMSVCMNRCIEGAISMDLLFDNHEQAHIVFIYRSSEEERAPRYSAVTLTHPDCLPPVWMV